MIFFLNKLYNENLKIKIIYVKYLNINYIIEIFKNENIDIKLSHLHI
jgi:hypothetical protein